MGRTQTTLNQEDILIIGQVLHAAASGPFFSARGKSDDPPSADLVHTLLGVHFEELEQVAEDWPHVDLTDETVHQAVWSVLGNITGYPHGCMRQWPKWISFSVEQVYQTAEKFRALYP